VNQSLGSHLVEELVDCVHVEQVESVPAHPRPVEEEQHEC
jgi:hypothetical protein